MKKQIKNVDTKKRIVIIACLFFIIILVLLFYFLFFNKDNTSSDSKKSNKLPSVTPEKKINIVDMKSNKRPIAVMIDNNVGNNSHVGLQDAYISYEIIVEGGLTRIMALYKDKDMSQVGPIRSSRHYFLDYALENDAIYVHYGQSPQAKSDIESLSISDINGIYESESLFWRDSSRYAPHNAVTSTANIEKIIEREGFRTTTHQEPVLNYVVEQELDSIEEIEQKEEQKMQENQEQQTTSQIQDAWEVTIPYSSYNTVKYEFDSETQTYIRYSREKKQVDWETKKEITTKNIIITFMENESIDSYGRQTLYNIKKADGYYITNGKAIPITCEKTSRGGKTIYKDLDGNKLKVNDGKTFIQICPINSEVEFQKSTASEK